MTSYYIDPVNGSDSNAGTSEGAPWATFNKAWTSGVAWVPGNSILLKRGRTFTEYPQARGSGTLTSPIYVGPYGSLSDGMPIIYAELGSSRQGFDLLSYTGITLDGLDIRGMDQYGIGWSLHNGSTIPITIRNCKVTARYNGIFCGLNNGGAGGLPGVIIEDNEVYDCGEHGIQINGGLAAFQVRRNIVRNCGSAVGAHGITVNQPNYDTNLTWSLTSGNVYQATITGATHTPSFPTTTSIDSVYIIFAGSRWVLTEDSLTTPASLAAGKYRYTGGVLYVNCNGNNPTSATWFEMTYGGQRGWTISDNIITGQQKFNGTEGASIQADDRANFGTITRNYCESTHTSGAIIGNGSDNLNITSNVVKVGGGSAIAVANYGNTCDISNNTIILAGGTGNAIEMWGTNAGGTRKANNNIIYGACTNAISDFYGAGASYELKNNCIVGPTNYTDTAGNLVAGNFTSTVTSDPALRSDYMPMSSAVRTAGTGGGGGDYYGNEFKYTPTIGAVQYEAARTLVSRTVAAGSVATRSLAFKRKVTA